MRTNLLSTKTVWRRLRRRRTKKTNKKCRILQCMQSKKRKRNSSKTKPKPLPSVKSMPGTATKRMSGMIRGKTTLKTTGKASKTRKLCTYVMSLRDTS